MADTLVVRIGAKVVGRHALTKKDTVLGRQGDIVLDSPRASTRHAVVRAVGFRDYVIIDLGSLNGTRVNDEPLAPNVERPLEHGDTIQIAQYIIRAVLSMSSGERPSVLPRDPNEPDRETDEGRPAFADLAFPSSGSEPSTLDLPGAPRPPTHVPVILPGAAGSAEETGRFPDAFGPSPSEETFKLPERVFVPSGERDASVIERTLDVPPPGAKRPPPPPAADAEETLGVPPPKGALPAAAAVPPTRPPPAPAAPPKRDITLTVGPPPKPAPPAPPPAKEPKVEAGKPAKEAAKPAPVAPAAPAKGAAAAPSAEAAAGPVRPRTTKTIQARLDHTYIDRVHPSRTSLRRAWIAAVIVAVLWVAGASSFGARTIFWSGPLSASHALLRDDCASCHTQSFAAVPDAACLACHDGLLSRPQLEAWRRLGHGRALAPASPTALASAAPGGPDASGRFATHHANQTETPACVACHVEHDGRRLLVEGVVDGHCTSCHASLGAAGGFSVASVAGRAIATFEEGHPEVAPVAAAKGLAWAQPEAAPPGSSASLAPGGKDRARVHLNHSVHMAAALAGMESEPRRAWVASAGRDHMICADCHEPDGANRYMAPVRFAKHCASCHGLSVTLGPIVEKDERLSRTIPIPHGQELSDLRSLLAGLGLEQEVRAFYERLIEANPGLLAAPASPGAPRPGPPSPYGRPPAPSSGGAKPAPKTAAEWVAAKVQGFTSPVMKVERGTKVPSRLGGTRDLERALFAQCLKCHFPSGASYSVDVDTLLAARAQDPGAKVSEAIRGEAERRADAAYAGAVLEATGGGAFIDALPAYPRAVPPAPDVLAPRIPERWLPGAVFDHEVHRVVGCLECHAGARTSQETIDVLLPSLETCKSCHARGGASTRCAECHEYHDKTSRRDFDGGLRIESLRRGDR